MAVFAYFLWQQSNFISFAGTDPTTLFSESYPHLIGCMSDIRFLNKEGNLVPISVSMMEGVLKECMDTCMDNPCHHGGQCINGYKEAICDCFGTDYQGSFCSKLGNEIQNSFFFKSANIITPLMKYVKFKSVNQDIEMFWCNKNIVFTHNIKLSVFPYIFVSYNVKVKIFYSRVNINLRNRCNWPCYIVCFRSDHSDIPWLWMANLCFTSVPWNCPHRGHEAKSRI